MAQLLTQEEIDSLLTAVSKGELPGTSGPGPGARRTESVLPYDFRRPNRISKEQIRSLQMLHDGFARSVSSSLSAALRTLVEVQLGSVEQLGYGEFMLSLASPGVLGVFEIAPLKGGALLALDPHLVFPMIDRILGGAGRPAGEPRELTEIERALVSRVVRQLLGDLQQSWQQLGPCEARLLNLETNPQFVMLAAPNDPATLVSFDIRLGESLGAMNLCLPFAMLEPLLPKLVAQRWFARTGAPESRGASAEVERALRAAPLNIRAVLPPIPVPIGRLVDLQPGDVLPLAGWPDLRVLLELEGTTCFRGRVGRRQRKRAVEVTTVLSGGDHHV